MIKRVVGIYFSPVGGTEKMTRLLAAGLVANLGERCPFDIEYETCDLLDMKEDVLTLDEETIAVIGMPVYIGKIPLPAVERLKRIDPNGAFTIATVSYGAKSCGDALYELQHVAENQGFNIIGAGAFAVRFGRQKDSPCENYMDCESLKDFCNAASSKIRRLAGCDIGGLKIRPAPVEVSGKLPVHGISRLSPRAAEVAQGILEKLNLGHSDSEWYL